jgi:hypothetical protein
MLLCGATDWRTEEIRTWKKLKNEVLDLGLLKWKFKGRKPSNSGTLNTDFTITYLAIQIINLHLKIRDTTQQTKVGFEQNFYKYVITFSRITNEQKQGNTNKSNRVFPLRY